MFIVGLLSWWYGAGWRQRVMLIRERVARTVDYFSIDLLFKTLFAPFRQISAGKINGSIGVKWRAFVDRTISRIIGSIIRIFIILIGCVTIILYGVMGLATLVLWAIIPALPLIGFLLFISGWTPL